MHPNRRACERVIVQRLTDSIFMQKTEDFESQHGIIEWSPLTTATGTSVVGPNPLLHWDVYVRLELTRVWGCGLRKDNSAGDDKGSFFVRGI